MRMLQHDCWRESTCELAHLYAPLPTNSASCVVRPASGTEHVQIMAAKNKYPLACEFQQVCLKVDHLYEMAFLVVRWVRLPGPEHASTVDFVDRH